jgi:transcriptional regulator with XRE-family HTH domain
MAEAELKDGPDGIDARVGRKIRGRRKQLGVSQPRLAASIGVSYQQLQKYEHGVNQVAPSRLAAIAAALDVSPGYFFATGAPDHIDSGPQALDLTCLAAAQAASEAASELVRVTREGTPVPVDGVLARLVDAARIVAELKSRPQDTELLVAIHRWNAEHA